MSEKLTLIDDHGPLYRVQLIDSLPLGTAGFSQAMPNSEDLRQVQQLNQRVVAGYEVLLRHFQVYHAVIEYLDNPSVLLELPQPHRHRLSELLHGKDLATTPTVDPATVKCDGNLKQIDFNWEGDA